MEGYYIIPVSSWRGVFGRVTEILFASKDHFEGHISAETTGSVDEIKELVKAKGLSSSEEIKRFLAMLNCPVERLYGSEYFASAVTFPTR